MLFLYKNYIYIEDHIIKTVVLRDSNAERSVGYMSQNKGNAKNKQEINIGTKRTDNSEHQEKHSKKKK